MYQQGSVMTSVILYVELLPKELRHRTEGAAMMSQYQHMCSLD
jgi:hypothetical protein